MNHTELPLSGVRVLAIEQMQAMPFATQIFARLGADVVKVEHPKHGDSGRASAPQITDADGRKVGATFMRNNLDKRSIAIDIKTPAGVKLIERLVSRFDILAENFKPGTMERFGLSYERLSQLHPGLVYVSVSGFGGLLPSPYSDWPAYAVVAEAMGGFYSFRPEPGRLPNIGVAGALGDIGSALFAAIGALAALEGRRRTGKGQRVDVAMMDSVMALMDMVPFNPSLGVRDNSLRAWPGICAAFQARDGLFVMQVAREHQFERLATALGRPEWLQDPRLSTREGWRDHVDDVIRPAVEAWAKDKTKRDAARILAEHDIVAGPSLDGDDLLEDPHVRAHEMIVSVERPDGGKPIHVVGNPIKLANSQVRPSTRWPTLGQHTDAVLEQELGLPEQERIALRKQGVIA
jgi:crotonobetainyl-CoA:carnitine CoA-transferase CaiB-like acyl-CoA transferase